MVQNVISLSAMDLLLGNDQYNGNLLRNKRNSHGPTKCAVSNPDTWRYNIYDSGNYFRFVQFREINQSARLCTKKVDLDLHLKLREENPNET